MLWIKIQKKQNYLQLDIYFFNLLSFNFHCLLKGLCASDLLFDLICSSKVEPTYNQQSEEKQIFSFNSTSDCLTKFNQIIPKMLQPSGPLKSFINEQIRGKEKISLMFIDVFIKKCIQLIDTEKQKWQVKDFENDNKSLQFEKYRTRVLGCQIKCPCCGRMCDIEHYKVQTSIGSEGNKHQCMRGHQFRAMIGFKMAKANMPSFRICEFMKDDEKIVNFGQRITWKEYKEQHPTWLFEVESMQAAKDWRARCVLIWQRIGEKLCSHFGMTYTSLANDSQPKTADCIHFVLVLDNSSSMVGPRWKALIHSVTNFLQIRSTDGNLEDRVTIILFSNEANTELFFEKIHPSIVDRITPKYHQGTNFSAALKRVIQTMSDAKKTSWSSQIRHCVHVRWRCKLPEFWIDGD